MEDSLASGTITPSKSLFGAFVFFVSKPDKSLWLVSKYRVLNKVTVKKKCPFPLMDDLFDSLAGATFFYKIGLTAGYNQVCMVPGDKPKTAICTHYKSFEYKVMNFSMTNAPSTLVTLMNTAFKRLIGVCMAIYLDDIIVYSKHCEELLKHLCKVFAFLQEYQLYAKTSKCKFFKDKLLFFGHIVSPAGIRPTPPRSTQQIACPLLKTSLNSAPSWAWLPTCTVTFPTVPS